MNTPEQITTRAEGATFYCADCRETYQQCKCKVYMSVDTIKQAKSGMRRLKSKASRQSFVALA